MPNPNDHPISAPVPDSPPADHTGAVGPDALLAAWLQARDVACPVCAYNLRDLRAAACPECSARLHLQVGSENLRLGPWFLAVLSLALALGFDGVVTLLMTAGLIIEPPPSPYAFRQVLTVLGSFILLAVLCGSGVYLLFRRRRGWARLPRRAQWRSAWILFATVGIAHALFGWWLATWL